MISDFETEFHRHREFFAKMAHKWGNTYKIPYDEALSLCWEAFYEAYQRYDPTSDASLTTFCSYYIMGHMSTYYRHNHRDDIMPDVDGVLDVGEEDNTLDAINNTMVRKKLEEAIVRLTPREQQVVHMYYWGHKQSVRTVGERLGVTPQRVSQILKTAQDKLYMILNKEDFYENA